MSKALPIILVAVVGCYILLFVMLMVRACAGYWQARRELLAPQIGRMTSAVVKVKRRAWTHAVWRGKLVQEMLLKDEAISTAAAAVAPNGSRVLC